MTTTTPNFKFRLKDGINRTVISEGEADTLEGAIDGAWALQRYHEAPVNIIDCREGTEEVLGTVNLKWLDS